MIQNIEFCFRLILFKITSIKIENKGNRQLYSLIFRAKRRPPHKLQELVFLGPPKLRRRKSLLYSNSKVVRDYVSVSLYSILRAS